MSIKKSGEMVYNSALLIVIILAIFWCYLQPHNWLLALCFAIGGSLLVIFVFNAGRIEGIEYAEAMALIKAKSKLHSDEAVSAGAVLDAFQSVMAEADLFAYELANNLVPDGYSESNPGLGPMDFNEWREWKQREFDRTGNADQTILTPKR